MRSNANEERIEGRLFSHHLEEKVSGPTSKHPGTPFISGTIELATDDNDLNIVEIHYTYVTELQKSGKKNSTYTNLKRIISEGKTVTANGHDEAWKIRATPSIALNDYYPHGQDELVSLPRNEGGFVSIISSLSDDPSQRNKFTADMLITGVVRDDSSDTPLAKVNGAIFNFRNDLLPIHFVIRNEDGINYFEDLGASSSEPVYTKVWGKIVSRTESITQETESAFGDAAVDMKQRRVREWMITGAQREPYSFGEGGLLTVEDVKKAVQNREVMLADIKQRSKEYYASHNASAKPTNTPISMTDGKFDF